MEVVDPRPVWGEGPETKGMGGRGYQPAYPGVGLAASTAKKGGEKSPPEVWSCLFLQGGGSLSDAALAHCGKVRTDWWWIDQFPTAEIPLPEKIIVLFPHRPQIVFPAEFFHAPRLPFWGVLVGVSVIAYTCLCQ